MCCNCHLLKYCVDFGMFLVVNANSFSAFKSGDCTDWLIVNPSMQVTPVGHQELLLEAVELLSALVIILFPLYSA